MSTDSRSALLDALAAELPADLVSLDPDDLAAYGRDWTRAYAAAPVAVARPRTTEDVARVMALCRRHGQAVVPSGGRTGLAGGAVAQRGELVLSLDRMAHIHPVDTVGRTVRVEAGAVTENVHAACAAHGLTCDLARWRPVERVPAPGPVPANLRVILTCAITSPIAM